MKKNTSIQLKNNFFMRITWKIEIEYYTWSTLFYNYLQDNKKRKQKYQFINIKTTHHTTDTNDENNPTFRLIQMTESERQTS